MKALMLKVAFFAFGCAGSAQANELYGQWARGDGKARVQIAPFGADICATNAWVKPGTPKEDKGDTLIMWIRQDNDGVYAGTAFDPKRYLTYNLTETINRDRMTSRGCVIAGLICRGIGWERINWRQRVVPRLSIGGKGECLIVLQDLQHEVRPHLCDLRLDQQPLVDELRETVEIPHPDIEHVICISRDGKG